MKAKFSFAQGLIYEAGQLLKESLDQPLTINEKSDFTDLVTDMDQKVQSFLINQILESYPEDSFLAEEDDYKTSIQKGAVWVIDPIDGTNNFVAQKSDFAICLAYYENGFGQFGLIYDVMADQLFYGGGQFDVCCNGRVLPSYQDKPLSQSLLALTHLIYRDNIGGAANLASHVLGLRAYGSAAISMSKVLTGQLVGYISHISPWDYAAAKIMGESLGYVTVSLIEKDLDFETRQYVMMVPKKKLGTIRELMEKTDS